MSEQHYKFIRATVVMCDTLVNILTHSHPDSLTDRQLLTSYVISSPSLGNENSESVIMMTSFIMFMTVLV